MGDYTFSNITNGVFVYWNDNSTGFVGQQNNSAQLATTIAGEAAALNPLLAPVAIGTAWYAMGTQQAVLQEDYAKGDYAAVAADIISEVGDAATIFGSLVELGAPLAGPAAPLVLAAGASIDALGGAIALAGPGLQQITQNEDAIYQFSVNVISAAEQAGADLYNNAANTAASEWTSIQGDLSSLQNVILPSSNNENGASASNDIGNLLNDTSSYAETTGLTPPSINLTASADSLSLSTANSNLFSTTGTENSTANGVSFDFAVTPGWNEDISTDPGNGIPVNQEFSNSADQFSVTYGVGDQTGQTGIGTPILTSATIDGQSFQASQSDINGIPYFLAATTGTEDANTENSSLNTTNTNLATDQTEIGQGTIPPSLEAPADDPIPGNIQGDVNTGVSDVPTDQSYGSQANTDANGEGPVADPPPQYSPPPPPPPPPPPDWYGDGDDDEDDDPDSGIDYNDDYYDDEDPPAYVYTLANGALASGATSTLVADQASTVASAFNPTMQGLSAAGLAFYGVGLDGAAAQAEGEAQATATIIGTAQSSGSAKFLINTANSLLSVVGSLVRVSVPASKEASLSFPNAGSVTVTKSGTKDIVGIPVLGGNSTTAGVRGSESSVSAFLTALSAAASAISNAAAAQTQSQADAVTVDLENAQVGSPADSVATNDAGATETAWATALQDLAWAVNDFQAAAANVNQAQQWLNTLNQISGELYYQRSDARAVSNLFAAQNDSAKALADGDAALQSLFSSVAQAWGVSQLSFVNPHVGNFTVAGNGLIVVPPAFDTSGNASYGGDGTVVDATTPSTYAILPNTELNISHFDAGANGSRLDFMEGASSTAVITQITVQGVISTQISDGLSYVVLLGVTPAALSLRDNILGASTVSLHGEGNELSFAPGNGYIDDGMVHVSAVQTDGTTNTFIGGNGADTFIAYNSGNTFIGGAGATTIESNLANNILKAGIGSTIASYSESGVTVNLSTGSATSLGSTGDQLIGITDAVVSGSYDTIIGGSGADVIIANGNNDTLIGGSGANTLIAGGLDDTLIAGSGVDTLQVTANALGTVELSGLIAGDVIDLPFLTFDASGSAILVPSRLYPTFELEIIETNQTFLNFLPTQNFVGEQFVLSADGNGGTDVTVVSATVVSISSGTIAGPTTVLSGTALDVLSGGIQSGATLGGGASEYVQLGGTASGTLISSGAVGDVESGGIASSTSISSGGLEIVDGTETAAQISGGVQYLFANAINNQIATEGNQYILSGGRAVNTTVSSGAQSVSSGGVASGTYVAAGRQNVFAGGTATGTVIGAGSLTISSGGIGSSTFVESGGAQIVAGGGTAIGATVEVGGIEAVYGLDSAATVAGQQLEEGGAAINATVLAGGLQNIFAGVGSGTVVSSGAIERINGGIAVSTIIANGGYQFVSAGAVASNSIISGGMLVLEPNAFLAGAATFAASGGELVIEDTKMPTAIISGFVVGDIIDFAKIPFGQNFETASLTGGNVVKIVEGLNTYSLQLDPTQNFSGAVIQSFSDGVSGTDIVISRPATVVSNGQIFDLASGTLTNVDVLSGGILIALSGGIGLGPIINGTAIISAGGEIVGANFESGSPYSPGGAEIVSSGGTAAANLIFAWATDTVETGGLAIGATVEGVQNIFGGIASETSVISGGQQNVFAGGTTISTVLSLGVELAWLGGTALSTIIDSGGAEENGVLTDSGAALGGLALDATINSGGYQLAAYAGADVDTLINSGGEQQISFDGTALSAQISFSGLQIILSGALAINTTVESGGTELIESGGTAQACFISSGGVLELLTGATTVGTTFAAGGILALNSGYSYSVGASLTSNNISVLSGAILDVLSGGTISGTSVQGSDTVSSGGTAVGTIIGSNGVETALARGITSNSIDEGLQNVQGGTTFQTTVFDGATQAVYSSGLAVGTLFGSDGDQTIWSGGVVSGAVFNGYALQQIGVSVSSGLGFAIQGGGDGGCDHHQRVKHADRTGRYS